MDLSYILTPLTTWVVTGLVKFSWNSISHKRLAFDLIGYGGMPSNHSAIVSSTVVIIMLREGIYSASACLAVTLGLIVILDAQSLRSQVGKHAKIINKLREGEFLRERIGHSKREILVGILVGAIVAWGIEYII